ncbi:hypothetical protein WICPIJ_009295 [Wickerhamomyces pijperi]|uniref:Serine/threonine-protein phosphatase 4 regulatory subunit 3-like central domain-containing protein n=1 Tax=Wickerhamomyces pijperi TaxID=599730 RepID=A0A9P8TDP9_WICPI|nr:hypothetical protein WICPIJ_009295 [Wickerhamomyces pijperi]
MTRSNKSINSLRRVKVYMLSDTWIDSGTGYCSGEFGLQDQSPYLLVKNEHNENEELLRAKIEGTIQFQRQQDTLIVWTDLDGNNIALSFQEKDGCTTLCDFIIKVQRERIAPEISLVSVVTNELEGDMTELITGPIRYPSLTPQCSDLVSILNCFNDNPNSLFYKQSIATFIKDNNFIPELVRLFEESESQRKIKNLHLLCNIVKTLILFNEGLVLDLILEDQSIMGIVGILEYDPDYPKFKSNHRQFLKDDTKFKEIVPLKNEHIENLIKKTYILQFLKDVVLARLLDDATFNLISSTIHFNQMDIIEYLIKGDFIDELFNIYQGSSKDPHTPVNANDILTHEETNQQRDGIRLLHQFVLMAKNLQPQHKTKFFKSLIKKGLLKTINFILHDTSVDIRVLGTEIVVAIIDHDVLIINGIDPEDRTSENSVDQDEKQLNGGEVFKSSEYEQAEDDDQLLGEEYNEQDNVGSQYRKVTLSSDMTLLKVLTKFLLEDSNPGLRLQAFEALKSLLNPVSNVSPMAAGGGEFDFLYEYHEDETKDHLETLAYFNAFYEEVAPLLFKPIMELNNKEEDQIEAAAATQSTDAAYDQALLIHLCELITFCSKDKVFSRAFFLENHILLGINKLIRPSYKLQLRLTAVRTLKSIIQLNDDYYTRYMIQYDLFDEVFQLFKETEGVPNLAYSTVLNLFEIILIGLEKLKDRKNFRILANHLVSRFSEQLNSISIVSSGKDLIKVVEETADSSMAVVEDNTATNGNLEEQEVDEENDDELDDLSEPEILTEPLQEEDILNNEILIQTNSAKMRKPVVYQEAEPTLLTEEKENHMITTATSSSSSSPSAEKQSPITPKRATLITLTTDESPSPSAKRKTIDDDDVDLESNRNDVKRKFTFKEKFTNASKKIASKFSSGNDQAQNSK